MVFCVVVLICLYVLLEFLRYHLADELESNEGCQAIGVIHRNKQALHPIKGYGVNLFAVMELIAIEQRLHQIVRLMVHLMIKIDGRPFWGKSYFTNNFC